MTLYSPSIPLYVSNYISYIYPNTYTWHIRLHFPSSAQCVSLVSRLLLLQLDESYLQATVKVLVAFFTGSTRCKSRDKSSIKRRLANPLPWLYDYFQPFSNQAILVLSNNLATHNYAKSWKGHAWQSHQAPANNYITTRSWKAVITLRQALIDIKFPSKMLSK